MFSTILIINSDIESVVHEYRESCIVRKLRRDENLQMLRKEMLNLKPVKPVMIYDLAALKSQTILKVVEEASFRLLCLSSVDCLSMQLMSRFDRVIKHMPLYGSLQRDPDAVIEEAVNLDYISYEKLADIAVMRDPLFLPHAYWLSRTPDPMRLVEIL